MKTQLTKEQSDKLLELGVPKGYASILRPTYARPSHESIFTLADLLKILPKEIKVNGKVNDEEFEAYLEMSMTKDVCFASYSYTYPEIEYYVEMRNEKELIDALYELLLWVIEAGYLKF